MSEKVSKPTPPVHLPTGGVAVFGRTGNGKSSMFYGSRYVTRVILADSGSMAHRLHSPDADVDDVTAAACTEASPITAVFNAVDAAAQHNQMFVLDSWTTLQEQQVAWMKRRNPNKPISIRDHGTVVGLLRDLALTLSARPGFTIFNTAPGGKGKTPEGQEIVYPAGAIVGYPSLSGVGANSETILARWSNVWGVFQGSGEVPRGLYVPGKDIRPERYALYSPLKDPLLVITDTSGKGVMEFPDLRLPENKGLCFVDKLLGLIAEKWPPGGRRA